MHSDEELIVHLREMSKQLESLPEWDIAGRKMAIRGYKATLYEIIERNSELVTSIAQQYKHPQPQELIQKGFEELKKAIEVYNQVKGTPFKHFATTYIKNSFEYQHMNEIFPGLIQDLSILEKLVEDSQPRLNLIFNLSEFDSEEIAGVISVLSDIYRSIGGDALEIKKIETFEFTNQFQPELI
jgi:hypothetical protein